MVTKKKIPFPSLPSLWQVILVTEFAKLFKYWQVANQFPNYCPRNYPDPTFVCYLASNTSCQQSLRNAFPAELIASKFDALITLPASPLAINWFVTGFDKTKCKLYSQLMDYVRHYLQKDHY